MPRTNHSIQQEELMAYLDGVVPADRAGAAARHLEHCRECQGLAADLQSVSRRLMEWQVEPIGQEMGSTLASSLEAYSVRPRQRARRITRWAWSLASVGAVALSAFVVIFNMSAPKYKRLQQFSALQAPERTRTQNIPLVSNNGPILIARTAQLILTTKEFEKARASLEDILKRHNGYLGQLNVNAPAGSGRTLNATLRIPAVQRDAAIAEIKKLGRVDSESQTGEEMTSQYVDLEARLLNARNTEQRLTDVLRQRTGKLADVLAVEQEISRVRGEIERMEAEKKNLTTRVEFVTLELNLMEEYRAQPQNSFRNAAIAGYKSMLAGVERVLLFLLAYGPGLLIWAAVLFFPARIAWRRFRRG
jgi:hypothetical protein